MTTFEQVREVIANELCVTEREVEPQVSFVSLGASSLDMAALVIELEEALGIDIPDDDMNKIVTVQDVVNYADWKRTL